MAKKIGKRKEEQTIVLQPGQEMDPQYVFEDILDTDKYQDITSNVSWHKVGKSHFDYQKVREQIATYTAIVTFANLPLADKEIAARYFVVDKTKRDTVLSEQEQQDFWAEFVLSMRKTRRVRWDHAKAYVSYVLTMDDSVDLARTTSNYSHEFIEFGVENKANDGVLGLYDYFENTGSITTWFGDKAYYDVAIRDRIMDILRNGNY